MKVKNEGNTKVKVRQLVDQMTQQEIQLAQPHQRKNIRREHNEGAFGDAVDSGDGIHSKNHIGGPDSDQNHQHRRENLLPSTVIRNLSP